MASTDHGKGSEGGSIGSDRKRAISTGHNGDIFGARDTLVQGLEPRPKGPFFGRHAGVGICCDDVLERDISERICGSLVPVTHVHRHDPSLVLGHFRRV